MKTPKTYEEYCLDFPEETQEILENLKNFIQNLLPESELCINYGIPTFKMKGKIVIHFGGFRNHIGLYPGSEAIEIFAEKLKKYKTSKGTVQFPLQEELPFDLIQEIVEFRKEKF